MRMLGMTYLGTLLVIAALIFISDLVTELAAWLSWL